MARDKGHTFRMLCRSIAYASAHDHSSSLIIFGTVPARNYAFDMATRMLCASIPHFVEVDRARNHILLKNGSRIKFVLTSFVETGYWASGGFSRAEEDNSVEYSSSSSKYNDALLALFEHINEEGRDA